MVSVQWGLRGMLAREQAAAATLGRYTAPRTPGKAKHVISLFLSGGPSQVDMFDPKPDLVKFAGQRPGSVDLRTERQTGGLMPTPFTFRKHGESGVEVSEVLPNLASVIDDMCVIRSMYSFNPTHTPALSLYHTGTVLLNRPSMGSWVSYGLGSENENLPSFVALDSGFGGGGGLGGSATRAGFLPAEHQGTPFNDAEVEPEKMIPDLRNKWVDKDGQRHQLDAIQAMNREYSQTLEAMSTWRAASNRWSQRTGCSLPQWMLSTPERSRSQSAKSMGPGRSRTAACWHGGLVERGVRYVHVGH